MRNIFLSYSWANIKIAEEIDNDFKSIGITLIRDVRDAPNYSPLSNFMITIRDCDYAILLISDEYLKSENCMFEATEYFKEIDFSLKIFPIFLDGIKKIRDLSWQVEYIKYWEKIQKQKISEIADLDPLNVTSQTERIKRIRLIAQNIGTFLDIISDKKILEFNELKEANYKPILDLIGFVVSNDELIKIQFLDNFHEKEVELDKYAEKYGTDWLFYFIKANNYYFIDNPTISIIYYKKALTLNPNNELIHNNIANALADCQEYQEARKHYEKAIEINPIYAEAFDNLANLLENDYYKDYILAKKHHEQALELNPNNAGIHYNYANLLHTAPFNDIDKAKKHCLMAIELNPKLTIAYIGIADIFIELGDFLSAITYLKKCFEFDNNNPYLHQKYADSLIKISPFNNAEEARKHYELALGLNLNDKNIHINLANILLFSFKDYFGARQHYEKAIELDPSEAVAYCQFALLLKSDTYKEYKKAIEYFEKAIELQPSISEFYFNYGNFLAHEYKYYRGAKLQYEKAIELEPTKILYHYGLAQLLENAFKDKKGANIHYEIIKTQMKDNGSSPLT
ncbi:MAG: tetratricopeptide repeat protein [Eubacteriaceae bacterium]